MQLEIGKYKNSLTESQTLLFKLIGIKSKSAVSRGSFHERAETIRFNSWKAENFKYVQRLVEEIEEPLKEEIMRLQLQNNSASYRKYDYFRDSPYGGWSYDDISFEIN